MTNIAVSCTVAAPIQKELEQYFSSLVGVAVDTHGNVFVADSGNNEVDEIPYSGGTYGAPVSVGSGFNGPSGIAVMRTAMCSWPIQATMRCRSFHTAAASTARR